MVSNFLVKGTADTISEETGKNQQLPQSSYQNKDIFRNGFGNSERKATITKDTAQ